MPGGGSIPAVAASKLLAVVGRTGVDPGDVMRTARFDPDWLIDPERVIPLIADYDLWCAAARLTGDPGLAIRVAESYSLDDYRLLGFACITSADLGQALERMARFIPLWVRGQRYRFEVVDGDGVLSMRQCAPPHPAHRLADESALAQLVGAARSMVVAEVTPARVRLAHPAPASDRAHRDLFRCRVEFDAPANQVVFRRDDLRVPTRKHHPAMARYFEEQCRRLLDGRTGRPTLAERVREAMGGDPRTGLPDVARRLGTSERSLRRHLAVDQLGFRALADEVRREAAERWLTDTDLPLAEVADRLGFADATGFHRAFVRWTGVAPGRFRRAGRA